MNTRRSTASREEGGVTNARIPLLVEQVSIVGLEEDNEQVPLHKPQVTSEPQEPQVTQVPPISKDPFVEGHMTNEDLKYVLMNFTQLLRTRDYIVNNHFVSEAKHGVGPQPKASTHSSIIWDFMRFNPPIFHGTNIDEDQKGFIH